MPLTHLEGGLEYPLPILRACSDVRPVEPGVYHVTEILNPPQMVWLNRHRDYTSTPDDMIWMILGTAFHAYMEKYGKGFEVEQSFRATIETPEGNAILTGTPDLYDPETKTLWDYKTTGEWFLQNKILKGKWNEIPHRDQLNIYRAYKFPEAEHLKLCCISRDARIRNDVVKRIHTVRVPLLEIDKVKTKVEGRLAEILRNEREPSTIRRCKNMERWEGRRCKHYCSVAAVCPQFQDEPPPGMPF